MDETESLLPCPFCGAQAFGPYISHGDICAEHPLNHYQIACSDQSHCGAVVTGGRLKTKADAVKHWNKVRQAVATKPFTPDWSLSDAAAESLREHMAARKAAEESEQRFRQEVTVALRELWVAIVKWKEPFPDDTGRIHNNALGICLEKLNAAQAKLGLGGVEESEPTAEEEQCLTT